MEYKPNHWKGSEMNANTDKTADKLTQQIGVLTRREVEARILGPVVEAMGREFGRQAVEKVLAETIVEIAREQGRDLALAMGGNTSGDFMESLKYWTKDNALEMDVLRDEGGDLNFNVTRCRYAEMYWALGMPELGQVFSCNRDFALIEGFNPKAKLVRTQTIMDGSAYCDFRYTFP